MYTLKISVTKEILEKSAYCAYDERAHNCAIAVAVSDIWPKAQVSQHFIHIKRDIIKLPLVAQDFIKQFDESLSNERMCMHPISFEVEVPDSFIDGIDIDEIKKVLNNHPTLELIDNN